MFGLFKLIPIIFAIYMVNACSDGGNSEGNSEVIVGNVALYAQALSVVAIVYYFHFDQVVL